MNDVVIARAPAKINLALSVGPTRPDGFHALATVYQALSLEDGVEVRASDDRVVRLVGDGVDIAGVPLDETNLAWRAAALLAQHAGLEVGFDITITKRIPVAGGLAGGSADAAAALVACDHLWGLGLPLQNLLELAARLGSDVPFAVLGGTGLGTGRGEEVAQLDASPLWWVVLPAAGGLSTPAVFAEFDKMVPDPPMPYVAPMLFDAVARGDATGLALLLDNDLQQVALALRPDLADAIRRGVGAGALRGLVSGSGPTTIFLCAGQAEAEQVARTLGGIVAHSVEYGARVVES